MKTCEVKYDTSFAVMVGNDRSQAAVMVLQPGDSTGGPDNRHRGSDQWLYVSAGSGEAIVAGETHPLGPQVVLLIERGETHEIRNTGEVPLETLNFYVPPAYTQDGETLTAGKS